MDVSDPTGKRVNRFTGEEVVPGNASRDPWAAITPTVAQTIASKATGSFVSWLPTAPCHCFDAPAAPPSGVGGEKDERLLPRRESGAPGAKGVAAAPPAAPTTGSITAERQRYCSRSHGNRCARRWKHALTAAIQRELQSKGMALANRPAAAAYRVEGAVTLGEAREGKQAIQIEWVVKDPQGKRLGTVSQKNDIPEGSLDGTWGRTADQAAGAAVQGIAKLLPSNKAVN